MVIILRFFFISIYFIMTFDWHHMKHWIKWHENNHLFEKIWSYCWKNFRKSLKNWWSMAYIPCTYTDDVKRSVTVATMMSYWFQSDVIGMPFCQGTTLKCLSIGTPKTINFPFFSSGKLMFFRCLNIQAHYNEAVIYLNFGTPKNNEFSIWNKWKIYYF